MTPFDTGQSHLRISLTQPSRANGIHVVRVDGRVDTLTSGELDDVLSALIERGQVNLIVDLGGVNYISSAGWGIFVARLRSVRDSGGDIVLARMTPPVRGVFDLLEFDGLLPNFDSLEGARGVFNGGSTRPQNLSAISVDQTRAMPPMEEMAPQTFETLDAAVLHLVTEDPFYSLGELRSRLTEIGYNRASRWRILRVLWRNRLLRPKRRFQYFRRQRGHSALS